MHMCLCDKWVTIDCAYWVTIDCAYCRVAQNTIVSMSVDDDFLWCGVVQNDCNGHDSSKAGAHGSGGAVGSRRNNSSPDGTIRRRSAMTSTL